MDLLRRNLALNARKITSTASSIASSDDVMTANVPTTINSTTSHVEAPAASIIRLQPPTEAASMVTSFHAEPSQQALNNPIPIELSSPSCSTQVVELDFFWDTFPAALTSELAACDIILAADVVYDPLITARFFRTLRTILGVGGGGGPKTAWVAVERRERVAEGGELVAPNFDLFTSQLRELDGLVVGEGGGRFRVRVEQEDPSLVPQHFLYSRVSQLTLWKIVSSCTLSSEI